MSELGVVGDNLRRPNIHTVIAIDGMLMGELASADTSGVLLSEVQLRGLRMIYPDVSDNDVLAIARRLLEMWRVGYSASFTGPPKHQRLEMIKS